MTKSAFPITALLLAVSASTGCATQPMTTAPDPSHHTANGYRNNYPSGWVRGSFWKWQMDRWRHGLPKIPEGGWHFDVERPDVAWLKANRTESAATWIGHATFLVQAGGLNMLTDPHLTVRASPLGFIGPKRITPPALDFHELPHIDAVVVSHNHYDHLDAGTVERLAAQAGGSPRFFVPLGLKAWFAGRGIHDVVELDWWQSAELHGVRFTLTPVQHWSARTLWDRNDTLWGGWRLDAPTFSFFFAGDTGYSEDFAEIRRRLGPVDLAALPIGAYEPRWFMKVMHINPDDAVQIHLDLEARHSVAMHWGTFILTDEPMDEPPHRLKTALRAAHVPESRFRVLQHGQTWRHLDAPPADVARQP
ncbi:MAG: MBL fold metallo-hydrolase [Burkholderiales bacterium]|nr:MBL fold metallo-hydrolase [Burkholderiales bacterium]